MAIPAGISTALVHLDAPISFIGDPGQLHVTIKSSVPLVWAATGTPLANFIDNINPGEGTELAVELPHTDQPGFLDGNGNTFTGWSYVVEIVYEKSGEQVHFPTREFQILTGQDSVDLALVPAGESYVPVVAPILPVTSLEGFTGAVTLTQLQLDLVDNTPDLAKPVSTATQTALNGKSNVGHLHQYSDFSALPEIGNAEDLNNYVTAGEWHQSSNAEAVAGLNYPSAVAGYLRVRAAAGMVYQWYSTYANNTMYVRAKYNTNWSAWTQLAVYIAADKAKLDNATSSNTASALVQRSATGGINVSAVGIVNAPTAVSDATRKDYVDSKVAAVTYGTLGVVPTSSLPPLAINETFPVADQAAMLALTAQRGDMAIRSDNGRTYVLSTDSPSTLADWKEVMAAGQVQSVAGKTGVVALVKADVGLSNVDNTADTAKPVSTAQQSALNLKANAANPAFTGTPTGLAKAHVGLGNVDNTSDANKPVSTAQAAEDAKLAKGRVHMYRVLTNSGSFSALTVVSNIPTFTFKANRKYRIVWDTDWLPSTGNVVTAFWVATCAVGDAAGSTTGITNIGVRNSSAVAGNISAPGFVTGYFEPTVDTTVQIKFLAQVDGTGGTMIVQGNRAGGSVFAIYDDGMQY